jgi:hypothetical protein
MTIAQQLMEWKSQFDPEPQRDILRDAVLAITDDPARADSLVPENPVQVTDSIHDAQLAAGVLMQGLPVAVKTGVNHIEYVETLLSSLALVIQKAQARGNMATMDEILGMQNLGQHIGQHIAIIAMDEKEKQRVKQYGDALGKLMNEVKAFAQRLQQQMQEAAQSNGQGQQDPEAQAKVQSMLIQAQVKAENARTSHAERTAQKQLAWEREEERRQQQHALDMQRKGLELDADIAAKDLETAASVRREGKKAKAKPESE